MFNIGRYKQAITRFEPIAVPINYKLACSPMDKIDFVLVMRRLRIVADWGVILDRHASVCKRHGEGLAHGPLWRCRTGDTGDYFLDSRLGLQGGILQKNGLLIIAGWLIRFTRYFFEPAGKRCEKLAARGQKRIKGKRKHAKEHAKQQAGKRSQEEHKERLAHAAALERIEGVQGRK